MTQREHVLRDGAIPAKYKHLMTMIVDALQSHPDGVTNIANRARGAGASEAEIQEAVEVAYLFGGTPALVTAMKRVQERVAVGVATKIWCEARAACDCGGQAGLREQPPPVVRRGLVVDGEEPEGAPHPVGPGLLQLVSSVRHVGRERLSDPVVEQEDPARCQHAPDLASTGNGSSKTCSTDDIDTRSTLPSACGSGFAVTSYCSSVSFTPASCRP